MTAVLTLINDYATRIVEYTIAPSADGSVPHLPTEVAPLAVTGFRLTYTSRRGSAWKLEIVTCTGNHAPDGQSGHAHRGQQHHYPENASTGRPGWLNDLMSTASDPDALLPARYTRTHDSAQRTIYSGISGTAEIPQWHPLNRPTPNPLRPDAVKFTYVAEDNVWRLDVAMFQGPWVATGQQPAPEQNRGEKPYYPTSPGGSLREAPAWVRDLIDRHSLPPALATV
ncbi:hypothetical protein OG883_44055 [Streptomyces sp. NBC_01142]|uniref:hypothetical protein n=1 Tax=Streptomyces sp. NBC_01142 TaxID=2975865 RepID=UPI002251DAFF|nr:hypothetical protein [Streptomyces sp. NBC_01142]MCX4826617.1 hypothetical protein [Streptomyces sp. NBC_01142]